MKINNVINIAKSGTINNVQKSSFSKINEVENKDFFKVHSFENDEYEGYLYFSMDSLPDKIYKAYYSINDLRFPPKFDLSKKHNLKLLIEEIEELKKVPKNTLTNISQDKKLSTKTDFTAEITEDLGEGCFKAQIKDLKEAVELSINNEYNLKIGDFVTGSGYLAIKT